MKPVINKNTFGRRLRESRLACGLSQTELARKVGTSNIMISRYERNEVNPTLDVLSRFSKSLNTSIGYLAGEASYLYDVEVQKIVEDLLAIPEKHQKMIRKMVSSCIRSVDENSEA